MTPEKKLTNIAPPTDAECNLCWHKLVGAAQFLEADGPTGDNIKKFGKDLQSAADLLTRLSLSLAEAKAKITRLNSREINLSVKCKAAETRVEALTKAMDEIASEVIAIATRARSEP